MSNSFEEFINTFEKSGLEAEQLLITLIKKKHKTYGEAARTLRDMKRGAYWYNKKLTIALIENVEITLNKEKDSLSLK